jgi:hypothetical protein
VLGYVALGLIAMLVFTAGFVGGLLFLSAFPAAFASLANHMIGAVGAWQTTHIVTALIGLYLTYVGWMPPSFKKLGNVHHTTRDLPRAA